MDINQSSSNGLPTAPMLPVLLLKTPSTPRDMYDEYFHKTTFAVRSRPATNKSIAGTNAGGSDESDDASYEHVQYTPMFVPVLSHRFHEENLQLVKSFFMPVAAQNHSSFSNAFSGQTKKYGGFIFTSQRAVEALGHLLENGHIPPEITTSTSKDLVLYTVGPATTRTLTPLRDRFLPHATIYGDEAGNGENLAHLILQHYNQRYASLPSETSAPTSKRAGLLFLVGEQRRDILPKTLMSNDLDDSKRINVDEVVVYETTQMEGFETAFRDAVSVVRTESAVPFWTVIFSPTGSDAVLRSLNILDDHNHVRNDVENDNHRRCRILTIGPTTRDYLITNYGFQPDVVARKPTPEGVGEGIKEFLLRK